jgi:Lon protease-like protein
VSCQPSAVSRQPIADSYIPTMPPTRLPLFPLTVVLFPGALIPLHIFEPRYRRMLTDCLEGDERFGITPPGPGGNHPAPGSVGCAAHIRACLPLPDGRANIVVQGEGRFVVRGYANEDRPYLVARVEGYDDAPGPPPPAEALEELRRTATRYVEAVRLLTDNPPEKLVWAAEVDELSFQVSAALEVDLDIKQELLRLRSAGERITTLLRILPPLVADMSARSRAHAGARTNGKGRAHPDIVPGG